MDNPVGYGFRPLDEEVVHHLRNKIEGKNELVQGEITEVNICSYDPWDLRRQYKYKSRDFVWYFFSRRDNKYGTGNRQSRTTRSGKWKLTGDPSYVKDDKRGLYFGVPLRKIGHKRVLQFLEGKNPEKTTADWIIHEFHYDLFPEQEKTYVVCRLEYKGNDKRYLFDNPTDPTPTLALNASEGSVVNQSRQGNSGSNNTYAEYNSANPAQWSNENFNMQQLMQGNSGFFNGLAQYDSTTYGPQFGENFNMQPLVEGYSQSFPEYDLTNPVQWSSDYHNLQQPVLYSVPNDYDSDIIWNCVNGVNHDSLGEERTFMQENFSDYRPKKPVTGVFSDDSDSDSDSTIFGDTSSSTDSVGRSNEPHDTPSLSTSDPLPNYEAQEQPRQQNLQVQSKEQVINTQQSECEWKMAEDSIKKTPSTNKVKQSWIVFEKSQRNAQWNYLKNMIIGILLFIYIIGWIILVH